MFSFRHRTATFGRLYVCLLSPWQISSRDNKVHYILFCLYNVSKNIFSQLLWFININEPKQHCHALFRGLGHCRLEASENKLELLNGKTLEVFPCFFQFYRVILLGRPHLEMLTSSLDFNLFGNGFINIPRLTDDKSTFSKVIAHVLPLWCCVKTHQETDRNPLILNKLTKWMLLAAPGWYFPPKITSERKECISNTAFQLFLPKCPIILAHLTLDK